MQKKIFISLFLIGNLFIMAEEQTRASSINCSSGSLEINGGLSIAGNLQVKGIITASGILNSAVGATGATGATGAQGSTGAAGTSTSTNPFFKLLIYYGYPSAVQVNGNAIKNQDGTPNLDGIAQALAEYDVIVLGAGLQSTSHPDHANTVKLISKIRAIKPNTLVFGYIDLGVSTNNFSIAQMQAFTDQWKLTGATGIFWDDAGYDFLTPRARQNAMILYARSKSLPSFMNAWNPDDVFSSTLVPTYNPTGTASAMGPNDWFLLESLPYNNETTTGPWAANGGWLDRQSLISRINGALAWRSQFKSKIAAVSIVNYAAGSGSTAANFNANNAYNQYVRNMIQAIGFAASLDAYGDSAQGFSASGPNANQIFKGWFDLEMARYGAMGYQPFNYDGLNGTTLNRYDYYTTIYYHAGNFAVVTPLTRAPLAPFGAPSGIPPAGQKGRITYGSNGTYQYDNGTSWQSI